MSISAVLGERRTVETSAGTIAYRSRGDGPPTVFVHGVAVNGDLWRHVAPPLADGHRCITPDWPWGSHTIALRADADLSLPGMARIVADLLEALDLEDVAIVANDTGGAVSQSLVGLHPERIGRLVLTSCDAFEKFPPTPQRYLEVAARSRALMWLVGWSAQFKLVQRLPTAYGWVTSRPLPRGDHALLHRAGAHDPRGAPRPGAAAARRGHALHVRGGGPVAHLRPPALVLWADGDRIFPREHGRRLAELLPQGRFELVADSRTFIPEEQPDRLVAAVREFLGQGRRTAHRP